MYVTKSNKTLKQEEIRYKFFKENGAPIDMLSTMN